MNLGLAPPKGPATQKPAQAHIDKLPKATNGNGVLKDSQVIIDHVIAEAKGSTPAAASDVKVSPST